MKKVIQLVALVMDLAAMMFFIHAARIDGLPALAAQAAWWIVTFLAVFAVMMVFEIFIYPSWRKKRGGLRPLNKP